MPRVKKRLTQTDRLATKRRRIDLEENFKINFDKFTTETLYLWKVKRFGKKSGKTQEGIMQEAVIQEAANFIHKFVEFVGVFQIDIQSSKREYFQRSRGETDFVETSLPESFEVIYEDKFQDDENLFFITFEDLPWDEVIEKEKLFIITGETAIYDYNTLIESIKYFQAKLTPYHTTLPTNSYLRTRRMNFDLDNIVKIEMLNTSNEDRNSSSLFGYGGVKVKTYNEVTGLIKIPLYSIEVNSASSQREGGLLMHMIPNTSSGILSVTNLSHLWSYWTIFKVFIGEKDPFIGQLDCTSESALLDGKCYYINPVQPVGQYPTTGIIPIQTTENNYYTFFNLYDFNSAEVSDVSRLINFNRNLTNKLQNSNFLKGNVILNGLRIGNADDEYDRNDSDNQTKGWIANIAPIELPNRIQKIEMSNISGNRSHYFKAFGIESEELNSGHSYIDGGNSSDISYFLLDCKVPSHTFSEKFEKFTLSIDIAEKTNGVFDKKTYSEYQNIIENSQNTILWEIFFTETLAQTKGLSIASLTFSTIFTNEFQIKFTSKNNEFIGELTLESANSIDEHWTLTNHIF